MTNAGSIGANGADGAGIDLGGGGSVANSAGASISGGAFGVFIGAAGGPSTVTNAGTISGGSYAVTFSSNAANRLVVQPGAAFIGAVNGGGGTLELADGSGAIAGVDDGAFNNFQTLDVDSGASWALGGTGIAPDVIDDGTLALAASPSAAITLDPSSTGNLVLPDSGSDLIMAQGGDAIFPGGGSDTIFAVGPVLTAVGTGSLFFVNGSNPSTVIGGGTGTAVINGGAGGGLFAGGTSGTNVILGGTGAATIFGSSGSDLLWAGGSQPDLLVAGSGNETLSGLGSSGNNVMYAGAGNDLLGGGSGNETFFAGSGNATIIGGSGADLFAFTNGLAGGTDSVFGFNAAQDDRIALQGYGANEVQNALAKAKVVNGSTTITLSDHTSITFAGVADLTQSDFT